VFKRSTQKLEAALTSKGVNTKVVLNAEKPRKGTFEVKIGDKVIVSLVAMPRPFKQLRELDLEVLAEQIIAA